MQSRADGRSHCYSGGGILRLLNGHLRAYSAADGKVLWDYDTGHEIKTINGDPAHGGSISVAGPVVVGGVVGLRHIWRGRGQCSPRLHGRRALAGSHPGSPARRWICLLIGSCSSALMLSATARRLPTAACVGWRKNCPKFAQKLPKPGLILNDLIRIRWVGLFQVFAQKTGTICG